VYKGHRAVLAMPASTTAGIITTIPTYPHFDHGATKKVLAQGASMNSGYGTGLSDDVVNNSPEFKDENLPLTIVTGISRLLTLLRYCCSRVNNEVMDMSAKSNLAPVIKRAKVIQGGGHHGGGWKVARGFRNGYDGVVDVLLNATNGTAKKQGLADYFTPTIPTVQASRR
jgi:hypothetical protein